MKQEEIMKNGIFGAIAGVLFPMIMGWIGKIPGIQFSPQATLTIPVANINTGAGSYLNQLTFLQNIPGNIYLTSAVGGAVFFIIGAFVVEWLLEGVLNMKTGNKTQKLGWTIFVASLVMGYALKTMAGLPTWQSVLTLAIGSLVSSYILVLLANVTKQQSLLPN